MNIVHESNRSLDQAQTVVDTFKLLYNTLNRDTIQSGLIDQVYADNMMFIDCFHRINGLDDFTQYCDSIYENVQHCQFEFHEEFVREDAAMLTWTMECIHPRLNKGKAIYVNGSSHIKFHEKVFYHQDYVDGGALLYEHVPVLGRVIAFLKKRMSASH